MKGSQKRCHSHCPQGKAAGAAQEGAGRLEDVFRPCVCQLGGQGERAAGQCASTGLISGHVPPITGWTPGLDDCLGPSLQEYLSSILKSKLDTEMPQ